MTDKENYSDESLAGFSDDALVRELERRRRLARDRYIERNRILAEALDKLFAEQPAATIAAGVNLQGEFGTALKNPENYKFKITATYCPEQK